MTTRADGAMRDTPAMIAVVIPCYRVSRHVLRVIEAVPDFVDLIVCVDDCCPEKSGDLIGRETKDLRVRVVNNPVNMGVGGAMITGYRAAASMGAAIAVKIDGDGQMDPALIARFVGPILDGSADYTKGNRFYRPESLTQMPAMRLFGNAVLSFMTKLSTGYWNLFDPTNGYTAVHTAVLSQLPLDKIAKRYFFESDMLFRLNTVRAVVVDVPMDAVYEDEESNLSISKILVPFVFGHMRNALKRLVYNYFLRDFNIASLHWVLGPTLFAFGVIFGASEWLQSTQSGVTASAGTVMLSALPIIVGVQMILSAFNFDIATVPRRPLHLDLATIELAKTSMRTSTAGALGAVAGRDTAVPEQLPSKRI
jgi:glycosyltransferase involved in cell wall biosynthesis